MRTKHSRRIVEEHIDQPLQSDRPIINQPFSNDVLYNNPNQILNNNINVNAVDDNIPQNIPPPNNINYGYNNYPRHNDDNNNQLREVRDPQFRNGILQQQIKILQKPSGAVEPLSGSTLQGKARNNFIKKVYAILGCIFLQFIMFIGQLIITICMCFVSYYSKQFLDFQLNNYWLLWVFLSLMIVCEIIIFCSGPGRKYPYNIIFLLIFTLSESYIVSFITSTLVIQGAAQIVIIAASMTLFIVVCLTLYAFFTKNDFTTLWGLVLVTVASIVMFGIFIWVAWTPILNTFYTTVGCFLFGIYLVVDTQLIIGNGRYFLSLDDYVGGAMLLYIDILQIFLYMLTLLGKC